MHNLILGKLWIDNVGEMVVTNHRTGDECRVKFETFSYFGGTPKKVSGRVVSKKGQVKYVVEGTWDAKVEGSPVVSETGTDKKVSVVNRKKISKTPMPKRVEISA